MEWLAPPAAASGGDKYRPSCSSRAADGVIRGGLVGLAWGLYFHPLHELVATGWIKEVPAEPAEPPARESGAASQPRASRPAAMSLRPAAAAAVVGAAPGAGAGAGAAASAAAAATARAAPAGGLGGVLDEARAFLRHSARPRLRSMGQASLMFGCFLGTFSGVSCASESLTGAQHWGNVFVGGTAAGALLAARNGSRHAVLATAFGTGLLTAVLHGASTGYVD
jgi:hypothetical protein